MLEIPSSPVAQDGVIEGGGAEVGQQRLQLGCLVGPVEAG